MKIKSFCVCALMVCATATFAQKTAANSSEEYAQQLTNQLKITDKQANTVIDIQNGYKEQLKKLSALQLADDEKRIRFQAIIDEKNEKLKAILADEQLKNFLPTTEYNRIKSTTKKN